MAHTAKRWPSPGILPELPGAKVRPGLSENEGQAVIGLLCRLLVALSCGKKRDPGDSSCLGARERRWVVGLPCPIQCCGQAGRGVRLHLAHSSLRKGVSPRRANTPHLQALASTYLDTCSAVHIHVCVHVNTCRTLRIVPDMVHMIWVPAVVVIGCTEGSLTPKHTQRDTDTQMCTFPNSEADTHPSVFP